MTFPHKLNFMPLLSARNHILYLLGLLLFTLNMQVYAADSIHWNELSTAQQEILQVLKDDWDDIPADRQQRLLKKTMDWQDLTAEQQQRFKHRMNAGRP